MCIYGLGLASRTSAVMTAHWCIPPGSATPTVRMAINRYSNVHQPVILKVSTKHSPRVSTSSLTLDPKHSPSQPYNRKTAETPNVHWAVISATKDASTRTKISRVMQIILPVSLSVEHSLETRKMEER